MDLLIRNGTLVDGTGAAPRPADIGIEAGQAQVGHEQVSRAIQQQIGRLDVPMNHALLVRECQRRGCRLA